MYTSRDDEDEDEEAGGLEGLDEMTSGDEEAMEDNIAFAEDDLEGEETLDLEDDDEDDLGDESDEDMALNLQTAEGVNQGPPDIQVVQMRISSALRALSDWKAHGKKTGKSRSEVFEQFIDDICSYYGYNKFLAEKLVELFTIDEVRVRLFLAGCVLTSLTTSQNHSVSLSSTRLTRPDLSPSV